jgi:CMP-N-acetylneuraminic acid synthetase
MLTNSAGKLICCTKEASKIVDIPVLREFQYFKPVTENIYTFNNPSLILHKNKGFRDAIKSLLTGKSKEVFYMENKKYTIYRSYIKETDWQLFKIIN